LEFTWDECDWEGENLVDRTVDAARLEARATKKKPGYLQFAETLRLFSALLLMWSAGRRPSSSAGQKGACSTMTPSIALPSLYREAVASFASGKSPDAVLDYLVEKGLPERYARSLMAVALSDSRMIKH
jgi:hypothetical protein